MKTKLICSTEKGEVGIWTDLPVLPQINHWIRVKEFVNEEEYKKIIQLAECWSGEKGVIESVEFRKNNEMHFMELLVWCED